MKRETNRMAWGLAAVMAGVAALGLGCEQQRRPSRYLIPDGYVGLVSIEYRVKGAPPLPIEDGFYLVKLPPGGLLKTSSAIEYGVAKDEYYYYSGATRRPLKQTGWSEGGMIWDGHISGPPQSNDPAFARVPWDAAKGFFVGTEVQLKESWFQTSRPSKLEKEFYNFGVVCGSEDGSRGVNYFAGNASEPPKKVAGPGKSEVYLAMLAGDTPGTAASKLARATNHKMAEAYKLHNLLLAARPDRQFGYVAAFKTGYGIGQLKIRAKRQPQAKPPDPPASTR
jgi:uncharacterized protein DUF6843